MFSSLMTDGIFRHRILEESISLKICSTSSIYKSWTAWITPKLRSRHGRFPLQDKGDLLSIRGTMGSIKDQGKKAKAESEQQYKRLPIWVQKAAALRDLGQCPLLLVVRVATPSASPGSSALRRLALFHLHRRHVRQNSKELLHFRVKFHNTIKTKQSIYRYNN